MKIQKLFHNLISAGREQRFPFRWKIVVPFLLLGIWLIVGGSYIITRIVFENADERFNNQLIEGGKLSTEYGVQEETSLLENLRLISYTMGVSTSIRNRDAEKLRELTYAIALNQRVEAVEFLDPDGMLIFSMRHRSGGQLEDYQFVRGGGNDFSREAFVQNALKARIDQRGDKYAGVVKIDRETYFFIAGPVYDEQSKNVGGVMVGTNLKTLISRLRDQTFARISLYDPNGDPVASSLESSSVKLLQSSDLSVLNQNKSLTRQIRVLETNFAELLIPWKARGQDLGLMGVAFAEPLFINPSIPTQFGMFFFVFAIFLLIITIGIVISNSVTRPLLNLTKASHEVSKGNLQIKVPFPAMNDELKDLTLTFNQMVSSLNQAQADILDTYDTTLVGWAKALELREKQTALHDQRVSDIAVLIARKLGVAGEDLVNIRRGALLHDIGKMGIPDSILNKPGPLTNEEYDVMKMHPVYAYDILSKIEYLKPALDIPYSHHEKWDGTGYPNGLTGEEIPFPARIFAVIDVWDAITTDRVYRSAMTFEQALEIIWKGRSTFFDPKIVDVFLDSIPELIPGKGLAVTATA